jgi:hypothetical protein
MKKHLRFAVFCTTVEVCISSTHSANFMHVRVYLIAIESSQAKPRSSGPD